MNWHIRSAFRLGYPLMNIFSHTVTTAISESEGRS